MFSNPSGPDGNRRAPDMDELRKSRKIMGELGQYYRDHPPQDYDEVWDYLNDNSPPSNKQRRAIHYAYMADHRDSVGYDDEDFEDAGRDNLDYEELEWFITEEDIVTREDLENAYGEEMARIDRNPASSMDRNDPMYDIGDRTFLVDLDEGDVEDEEPMIQVSDTHEACQEAISALNNAESMCVELQNELQVNRKNPTFMSIMSNINKARMYLYGLDHCPDE